MSAPAEASSGANTFRGSPPTSPIAATILVVDDEIDNRKLIEAMLASEGYLTLTAASGEEALALIAHRAPDLVLLDVLMPGMDGNQVARQLKADPATAAIPIIMVTAKLDRDARLEGLDAGAEDFLTKPVDPAELWLRVRNLLRLKTVGDLLRDQSGMLEQQVQARTDSLQASELRFRQVAENIHDVFFLNDVEGRRVLYVSPAYEEIWGRTCASLYADPGSWDDAIHPDDRAAARENYSKGLSAEKFELEYRIVRPDGAIRWIETRVFPVRDSAGSAVRVAGIATDATDRKKADRELHESDKRFSDLLGNVEMVSVMLDTNARITYCNDYLLRLTGWRREEVLGKDWFAQFMPAELGDMKPVFAALLLDSPEAWHREQEMLTRSGERRLIRWNNSVLRSGAGEVTGTASIGEDITQQKRSEIRISRLNRVYAVLSGINTLIVRVHDRQALFDEACRITVEHGNFGMAWIGVFDPGTLDVTPVAWAGERAEEWSRDKSSASIDSPRGKGVVGQAIRERRPVLNNDITAHSVGRVRLTEMVKLGFRSQIALPLFDENQQVVAILTMYARETNFFDEEELRLLTELSGDISFAVQSIGRQQKLVKLARIRAVSGEINAAIVRIRGRRALLEETCRIMSEHGKFEMTWIGTVDQHAQEVEAIAWTGFLEESARSVGWARVSPPKGTLGEAVQSGKPAVRNDLESSLPGGRLREEALNHGCLSSVCLPLVIGDTVVAAVALFATERGFFDPGEVALLEEVTGNLSFALEHIAKEEKIARLSRIQAVMGGINALIVRVHDRQELFGEACRIAVEHGNFGLAWIGRLDAAAVHVTPVAWCGASAEELLKTRPTTRLDTSEGNGVVGSAIRQRKPVFNNDIGLGGSAGPRRAKALALGFRSQIALPLFEHGVVAATLTLYARESDFFDEEELRLLTELAGDISFAVENISRQHKLEKLGRIRAVSSEINAAILRIPDRQELLEATCSIAVTHGGFPLAWIGMFDAATQDLKAAAAAGPAIEYGQFLAPSIRAGVPAGHGTNGRAFRERKGIIENDLAADPNAGFMRNEGLARGIRAAMSLPLLVEGTPLGVIGLYATEKDYFDDEESALLTEVAANVSFALAHIDKEEKIARLSRIHAVKGSINALIVRVSDRQELFDEACRIAVEDGKFGIAWIGTVDPSTLDVTPVAHAGHQTADSLTRLKSSGSAGNSRGQGVVGRAIRERKPVFAGNLSGTTPPGERRAEAVRRGFHSRIALPLVTDEGVVGVLVLFAKEQDFFDEGELRLLTELAVDISFSVGNIRRQQKLDKLARIRAVSSEVNAVIVRIDDREALLREISRIAVEHGKFELVWVALIDQAKEHVRAVAWSGFLPEIAQGATWAGLSRPGVNTAEVMRTRKVAVRNEIDTDMPAGPMRQEAIHRGYRSAVCVPFMVGDGVVAVMNLYAPGGGFFDHEELALLNEVAGNVSFALGHIEREKKIARLSRIQAVTGGINALIVRVRDRDELFREACRIAVQSGKFPLAWVAVADQLDHRVTAVAWAGDESGFLQLTRTTVDAQGQGKAGLGAQAIASLQPAICNDITAEDCGMRYPAEALERGYRSAVALPLAVDGAARGALVLYAAETGFFDAEEMTLLTELAGDLSFALDNISRQQKLDKLGRIRAVSSEINAAIIRIHDREALLRETCRIAVEHGKFELVWIGTIDTPQQKAEAIAWAGFSPEVAHALTWQNIVSVGGTLATAIETRKPAVRHDLPGSAAGTLRQVAMARGCRSTACLPLLVGEEVVAIIVLFGPGSGFFDEEELALLQEVTSDVSFALGSLEKQKKLDYLSYYDALTGLANRSLFLERVSQYMRSAAAGGHQLAVGLIDLERFKNINDSLGRPAGDALLKQVAEWLKRSLGDVNLLARLGADHFAVVLPEVKQDRDVSRLVEKVIKAFIDHPFRLDDTVFRITPKVGVACFPDHGVDADTLFKNAEAALKKAKTSGERYLFYTQNMTATVAGKLTLENQLRQALDKGEFVLHYQPKVNLLSGKLTGAEALIRWNDPRTGLVPPGQFIPVLEETGLIYDVGRWALRQAIDDYLRWGGAGLAALRVAVNVSPLQLRNRAFITDIGQAVGIHAAAAAGLELEITESLIMEDVKNSIVSLQAIRALGVTIAIDDFGTGFSSLSYLAKLPVDTLKIDRSFVVDMTSGPDGLSLVSTIINLAHSLKLKVVAEGVETEEQSRLLRLFNCDEMQGFLFSRPLPREEFEAAYLVPAPSPAT